jgi:pimeloyl-ACP methyl ester carboxylesterase
VLAETRPWIRKIETGFYACFAPCGNDHGSCLHRSAVRFFAAAQLQLQYQGIRCPVRIVHGKRDRFIEADQSRRLPEALLRSLLHIVEDAGIA